MVGWALPEGAGPARPVGEQREQLVATADLDRDTFVEFYRSVLRPAFNDDELITLDEACASYLGGRADPGVVLFADGQPVAGILASTFRDSGVLLINYLAVRSDLRSHGYGARLIGAAVPQWLSTLRPALVVAEVERPDCHAPHAAAGDPSARLRFYERHGCLMLAMPYFQPALRPGAPRVPGMALITFGAGDGPVPNGLVSDFLTSYVAAAEGPEALADPQVRALLDWVAARRDGIDLLPPHRYAEVPAAAPPPAGGHAPAPHAG